METEEKSEIDQGKLFIGGISWDSNEDSLKKYFGSYGVVDEAVIMRDRTTGRARGFGFVVFADPAVADRVVKEEHVIDGRRVEAKKAVPRDDKHLINRRSNNPEHGPTKKIFVGGLGSSITGKDLKNYFDQFGSITNVAAMYDQHTQRPRGFGFITYDSEDAVDRVLHKTFHELKGKMVEVKRALPKELSQGPSRRLLAGYNRRANNLFNHYAQLYNLSSVGGYGVRMDGRYSPLTNGQASISPFGSPSYGMGVNMEQGSTAACFGSGSNFSNNLGYGSVLNPYYASNQSKYNIPIGYNASSSKDDTFLNSSSLNVWGNGGLNTSPNKTSSTPYFDSGSGGFGVFGTNWDTNLIGYARGNFNYRDGRSTESGVAMSSSVVASPGDSCGDFYHCDPTWQTTSTELHNSNSFSYGLANKEDDAAKESKDNVVDCDIPNSQSSKGTAA